MSTPPHRTEIIYTRYFTSDLHRAILSVVAGRKQLWSLFPPLCWPLQTHRNKWGIFIEGFCDLLLVSAGVLVSNGDSGKTHCPPPQGSLHRAGLPSGRQIHGAFQVLCTQKGFAVTVCATSSPWLNIFFSCNPLPLSSMDSDGAVSTLGGLFPDSQAVCSSQLHQFLEVHSSKVCCVGGFLAGYRKLSLAVGGGEWGRSSSITWLLQSHEGDESPEASGSSLTLTFPSIRKPSWLAWH